MSLPQALAPLATRRQFITVLFEPKPDKPGKTDKFPLHPDTGRVVSAHDPKVWLSYEEAKARAEAWGPAWGKELGVGFVITRDDPFWCLDIDGAMNCVGWTQFATDLCSRIPGTAIEISHSGNGLHVWGSGGLVGEGRRKKRVDLGIELYSEGRFIALGSHGATGAIADPNPVTTAAVQAVAAEFFPEIESGFAGDHDGPSPEWRGPTDDAELLRRALNSKSLRAVFGNGATFADLWDANESVLARAYPDPTGARSYDASSADAALAQHLAFWTGRDVARIERLMRQSSLARPKWDAHSSYLVEMTIQSACGRQKDVLQDKPMELPPASVAEANAALAAQLATASSEPPLQTDVVGTTFLTAAQQKELFKGCVYVVDEHKVLVPRGLLLDPGRFKATYGGYVFSMDAANTRTVRNAFEAFTESQVLRPPRADGTCFKPRLPPGTVVNEGGRTLANTWWPVDVKQTEGDPSRFLNHLAKLLPDERDQQILLSYMAACVQYPGVKFQWAPLIQGVEGNGKSLLSACVAEAIGRRYVHWPKARHIANQFNAWLYGNLFYAVEDIHTPEGQDVIEELKPMITSAYGIEIEKKGVDQASKDICGNFMFNSNHKNGLRKTANDRRFAVFYCAQQSVTDLHRDGMANDYMKGMYDWLQQQDGFAIVTRFLKTWQIPAEFNPAGACQRAPRTSSTDEALANGMGRLEQEVLEAIAQDTPGFCGGWVSSMALAKLLERLGRIAMLAPSRRRDMMQALGYDWHPALASGRVHNQVMPDAGKPTLFIHHSNPAISLTNPHEIAKAYTAAQTAHIPGAR